MDMAMASQTKTRSTIGSLDLAFFGRVISPAILNNARFMTLTTRDASQIPDKQERQNLPRSHQHAEKRTRHLEPSRLRSHEFGFPFHQDGGRLHKKMRWLQANIHKALPLRNWTKHRRIRNAPMHSTSKMRVGKIINPVTRFVKSLKNSTLVIWRGLQTPLQEGWCSSFSQLLSTQPFWSVALRHRFIALSHSVKLQMIRSWSIL